MAEKKHDSWIEYMFDENTGDLEHTKKVKEVKAEFKGNPKGLVLLKSLIAVCELAYETKGANIPDLRIKNPKPGTKDFTFDPGPPPRWV